MKVLRGRKYLFALLALLAVFAACKGESPTAPTAGGGGGGGTGGGGTPPVGATITLTVSNPNPLTSSTTVITATVTQGGNPVQNGTAVEFGTSLGAFTDTGLATTIKTTTNGVATATLTSASAGTAVVTAVVNNVTRTTSVTFSATPVTPPPPTTAPTITSISPTSGKPEGGDIVTITGTNFRTPVRVLLDLGGGVTREAFVTSVTPTQVQFITPQVNLGAGQTLDANISLINEAGTPNEVKVAGSSPFTFRKAQLTPSITTVSPDSGPITGGTRITIFGSGFEAPVQVSFGTSGTFAQMQVISTTFTQIVAITPTARDVNPNGSGTLTGPVDLRVININSATNATATGVFRYTPAMQITGARPLIGSALGGTDVTIDGIGFDPPVDVFVGGVLAQVLRVSGSQILARTSPLANPCSGGGGKINVTNINNGDTAEAPVNFAFIGVFPVITSINPSTGITPGSTLTVSVQDPGIGPLGSAIVKFTIGGQSITPTPNVITTGTGVQTFTIVVPSTGFTFPTVPCTTASSTPGTQLGTITQTLQFTNVTTTCTATLDGMVLTPPAPNTCLAPPTATSSAPPCPIGVVLPPVAAAGTGTAANTFTISNAASTRDLLIGTPTVAAGTTNPPTTITVSPNTQQTVTAGNSVTYTITVDPSAVGPYTGTITFTTNDPTKAQLQVCFSGSGT
jgi:IPT/TIG domain-containing protein